MTFRDALKRVPRSLWLVAAIVGVIAILWPWRDVPHHWRAARQGLRPLLAAKSWHYQLQNLDADRMSLVDADVIVTEYSRNDPYKPDDVRPFTKDDLSKLKARPGRPPRIVLSYFSIGEAESYRFYWKPEWSRGNAPAWLMAENCAWPRNYMVRFWDEGWRDVIYRGSDSFLKRIIDVGFDGIYLDRIDVHEQFAKEQPRARDAMIDFVRDIATTARRLKPGFFVVAQNGEDLFSSRRYRDVVDGLGKEDLLYGQDGTNQPNSARSVARSVAAARKLQWDYKPVFAVEYLSKPDLIGVARRQMTSLGFVPTFAHRSLDGGDPTAPRAERTIKYGTAEWIAANCRGKPHW